MSNDINVKNDFFDEYTDEICKYISRRHKADVKEELLYHLDENYKTFLMLGLDEREAAEKSIEKMGDKTALSEKFKKVYENPFYIDLRSSVNFIISGIIFYNYFLNLFSGTEVISKILGALLLLYGMYRMRKTDRKIFASMIVFSVSLLILAAAKFLRCYGGIEHITELVLFNQVFWFTAHILLFAGLSRVVKREIQKEDKKPHILFWGISWTTVFSSFIFVLSENTDMGFFGYILLAHTVCMIVSLYRVRNIIGRKESEILVRQKLNIREKSICSLMAVFLVIVLPLFAMTFGYTRQPRFVEYNKNDMKMTESDNAAIKAHLLELGFPEERFDDLPASEIKQYKNAISMEKQFTVDNGIGKEIEEYYFILPGGEFRVLYCILCNSEQSERIFRDAVFYQFEPTQMIGLSYSSEDNKELNLILAQKDGKTYRYEPIDTAKHTSYPTYYGCEFSFPHGTENRRIYMAATGCITDCSLRQDLYIKRIYYHMQVPLSLRSVRFTELGEKRLVYNTSEEDQDINGYRGYYIGTYFLYDPIESTQKIQ